MINYVTKITGIDKDIKDGKWILKSQGDINGNINAQTVIVYGDVKGNIKADQVVVINGKATGNIHADTVVGLKDKKTEKKSCNSCKFLCYHCNSRYIDYCDRLEMTVLKDGEICKFYQEKEKENPAKQVSSPTLPVKKQIQQNSIKNISRVPVRLSQINKRRIRQKGDAGVRLNLD